MSQLIGTGSKPIASLFFDESVRGVETTYSSSKGPMSRNAPFAYGESSATAEEEHQRAVLEKSEGNDENYTELPHQQRSQQPKVHYPPQHTNPISESRRQHAMGNNYLERELSVQHKPLTSNPNQQGQRSMMPSQRARDPMYDTVAGAPTAQHPLPKRAVHGHQETNKRMVPNVSIKSNEFESPFMDQSSSGPHDSFAAGSGSHHVGGAPLSRSSQQQSGPIGTSVGVPHRQASPCPVHSSNEKRGMTPAPWLK